MTQKNAIYGIHSVLSVLNNGSRKVYEILYTNSTKTKIPEKFLHLGRLSSDYEISKIIEFLQNDLPEELEKTDTDLLNIRDEMLGLLNKTKYLLLLK